MELVLKEKCFAKWKNGERQVGSESEGLYVSKRLGFILEITERNLSSGGTRFPPGNVEKGLEGLGDCRTLIQ